jgi:hypothetical protein
MESNGQAAAHPRQSTHLSASIFLALASAQFIGQARSHIPQDTHFSASMDSLISATLEANPNTAPTGHQSQNRLPRRQEAITIRRKNARTAIVQAVAPPRAKSEIPSAALPKFDIGSGTMKRGLSAAITPTAAPAATAYLIFSGAIYFFPAARSFADALHKNS